MDERFEFDGAEIQALLAESDAAEERAMTEAQRLVAAGVDLANADPTALDEVDHPGTGAPPGVVLRNDRGVYLTSNALRPPAHRVAHARGFRAEVAVGDETVEEFIAAAPLRQLRPDDTLVVTLSEQKVRLSLLRPA